MTEERNFHTLLLRFGQGVQQPTYRPGMKVLGGELVAVAFDDLMRRVDDLELIIEERERSLSAATERLKIMDEVLDAATGQFARIGIPEPVDGFRQNPRDLIVALNDLNTRFCVTPEGPNDPEQE